MGFITIWAAFSVLILTLLSNPQLIANTGAENMTGIFSSGGSLIGQTFLLILGAVEGSYLLAYAIYRTIKKYRPVTPFDPYHVDY